MPLILRLLYKKLRTLLILVPALALVVAPAQARCGTTCLGLKLQALQRRLLPQRVERLEAQVEEQDRYISWLEDRATRVESRLSAIQATMKCFGEVPLTRYGEEIGPSGYLFQLEQPGGPLTLATTALDLTYGADPVGAWFLVNACNKESVESATQQFSPVRQYRVPTARFYGTRTPGLGLHWSAER